MPANTPVENLIRPRPLVQSNFAIFGRVIESPLASDVTALSISISSLNTSFKPANQNTALKGTNISPWVDNYDQSKSFKAGLPTISLFSCFPRALSSSSSLEPSFFSIRILERHPYTTQTFVPLGLSPEDTSTCYLVIVAPTLPPTEDFPEKGPPDLRRLQAFIAHGRQAVTYGAATWHAPMVVVGRKRVDFVVVQSTNGVPEDDCQEVEIKGDGLAVQLDLGDTLISRDSKL